MLVLGLLLFGLLVVVHELGHFIVARRNGVEVEEFGIGFPPKIWGKTLGRGIWRTHYTINLLPLGGFVRLKGENEADKRSGSFGATSFWAKTKITLAGVAMNYIVAVILLSIVAAIRLPVLFDGQFTVASDTTTLRREVVVAVVAEDSAAETAGLEPGDIIQAFNGVGLTSGEQLAELTRTHAGQTVSLRFVREAETREARATLAAQPADGESYLGVGPHDVIERRVGWSAPIVGFVVTNQFAAETLRLLGSAVADLVRGDTAAASAGVTGPVGIVGILREISSIAQLLLITGAISLSLAVMNALPIPALDGGRLALSGIFKLLKKPLTARVENAVHTAGFVVLIGLVVLISIVDVKRFF